ncbi:hypothetical protein AB0873_11545 [Micromonospora sp. NPDC047707]|uniref:hypothetical protein n=1 Tax=Micromonospora sp. NPDC047707 TaxID=3154498 RepID=UPI00345356ED
MNNTLPVCRAHWADIPDIVELVVAPFVGSPISEWLVPDERRRRDVLGSVLRIWTEHALLFGEAYLLQDRSAAAVWLHRYGPIPRTSGYGERLAAACGDYVDRFLLLDDVLRTHRPARPHNHLAFFAVAPNGPRVRRATALLAASTARMGQALLPTYTEATSVADRDLYARHGYVCGEPFTLPDGTTTYPMWRSPGQRKPGPGSTVTGARPHRPARRRRSPDLPVRVVLDASAIVAFTTGSAAVDETIAQVVEEGYLFGLPVACLAEASRSVVDTARLDLLVDHPAAAVLTVDPLSWSALANTYRAVGRLDTASVLLAAAHNECTILTAGPDQYTGLTGDEPIMPA